ncbi:MAG: M15 family metallopeptidase [Bacteroidales bacterium]|nr:M15 family metallopeptidase [Bacteroidales bacterium]
MRSLILILLFFSLSVTAQQPTKENPYQLDLIEDIAGYQRMTAQGNIMQMVDLKAFIPSLVLDIRYATTDNFTNEIIYPEAAAFARLPVAIALEKVQQEFNKSGLGLKIFDAYRPYAATLRFYELFPDTTFVAAPWHGSRHNRGAAIDLTLIDLKTNEELEMPTPFDDFTEKAAPDYTALPENLKKNRDLLRSVMEKHGFTVYYAEWWHFDYQGWEQFPLMNLSFDDLRSQQ